MGSQKNKTGPFAGPTEATIKRLKLYATFPIVMAREDIDSVLLLPAPSETPTQLDAFWFFQFSKSASALYIFEKW